jgi:hypothetical protein
VACTGVDRRATKWLIPGSKLTHSGPLVERILSAAAGVEVRFDFGDCEALLVRHNRDWLCAKMAVLLDHGLYGLEHRPTGMVKSGMTLQEQSTADVIGESVPSLGVAVMTRASSFS